MARTPLSFTTLAPVVKLLCMHMHGCLPGSLTHIHASPRQVRARQADDARQELAQMVASSEAAIKQVRVSTLVLAQCGLQWF